MAWKAASQCPSCPSDSATVEPILEGGLTVGCSFVCDVCGAMSLEFYEKRRQSFYRHES